ncbi:hypothetical protein O3G_MSEX000354 [Manduca sexta]|nr:hypothetical protein O3G_MSEX000354 [Manduca sexta]
MNVLRSPTGSDLRDALSDSQINESQVVNFRNKRKHPCEREDIAVIKKEVCELSSNMAQMMSMLNSLCANQKEFMEKISLDVADLKDQVNSIKLTVDLVNKEHKTLRSDVTNLSTMQKNIEEKILNLESEITDFKKSPATCPTSTKTEAIVAEINERKYRSKNIVVVGIPENTATNREDRMKSDKSAITKILETINAPCSEPIRINRLGKYISGKNRPIKISFDSQETAKYILKNKKKLQSDKIKLYSDQTPIQKLYLKELTQELTSRIEKGEKNLTIKYINNVPKIINIPKNSE